MIGAGSIGERHVRCFLATGRADVSILETQAETRLRVTARYPLAGSFEDLEKALENPPQVAVIATPAPLHVPLALRLANAGIHLLIEKPLSISLAGIDELAAIALDQRLTVGVAYVYRVHPVLAAMRAAILAGDFGEPVEMVVVSGQHFPTYRPAYRQIYYAERATGGGAIQDALTHLVNAGEWLVGPIDRLVADGGRLVLEGVNVEDTVHLLARHGPVLASYVLNQHQAPNEWSLTVHGRRGTARFDSERQEWRSMSKPETPWRVEKDVNLARDDLFVAQANGFLDAVENAAAPPCDLAAGIQTLRVNLAALASLDSGTWRNVNSRP